MLNLQLFGKSGQAMAGPARPVRAGKYGSSASGSTGFVDGTARLGSPSSCFNHTPGPFWAAVQLDSSRARGQYRKILRRFSLREMIASTFSGESNTGLTNVNRPQAEKTPSADVDVPSTFPVTWATLGYVVELTHHQPKGLTLAGGAAALFQRLSSSSASAVVSLGIFSLSCTLITSHAEAASE